MGNTYPLICNVEIRTTNNICIAQTFLRATKVRCTSLSQDSTPSLVSDSVARRGSHSSSVPAPVLACIIGDVVILRGTTRSSSASDLALEWVVVACR